MHWTHNLVHSSSSLAYSAGLQYPGQHTPNRSGQLPASSMNGRPRDFVVARHGHHGVVMIYTKMDYLQLKDYLYYSDKV